MFFDSHAHYDDKKFDDDRYEILDNMKSKGVSLILNAASSIESSKTCIELAQKYDFVYASVGIHPHDSKSFLPDDVEVLKKLSESSKVKAIGEIGLDYHYDFSPRDIQKKVFVKQILLAKELDLPIIVHEREAAADCFSIIKNFDIKGVYHCYSGSIEMAKEILKRGFYISFAGPVTFSNSTKLLEVVKSIPLDRILIETDCPYLSPMPHRGKRNNSEYVYFIAKKIAELKQEAIEKIAEITMENARRLFEI
jgi:TatD DNase family protein